MAVWRPAEIAELRRGNALPSPPLDRRCLRASFSIPESPDPPRAALAGLPVLGLAFEADEIDHLRLAMLLDRLDERLGFVKERDHRETNLPITHIPVWLACHENHLGSSR